MKKSKINVVKKKLIEQNETATYSAQLLGRLWRAGIFHRFPKGFAQMLLIFADLKEKK